MKLYIPLLILGFLMNNSVSAQFTSGMTYTDSNGNSINPYSILEDNKYIYLDFFSTSCGACNSVADEVANACESYGSNNSNVVFIGVDYNSTASSCQDFATSHNSSFPIIAGQETGASIFSLFGVTGYPAGKLINPSGEIEASFTYSQIVNLTNNLSSYIPPINECDLVSILSLELNTQNQSLELTVITDAPYMYPYPSFMLMNENGDTLAQEQVNYYGLSDYETTHALELLSDYNSWDDNLILNLYSGFYDLLECSFEVNLGDLEIMGCTDDLAMNYSPNSSIDDGSCTYAACYYLGFELLESEITFTESVVSDGYSLNIPIVNYSSNWLAYPMIETYILNPLEGMTCENCEFNVIGNPWSEFETLSAEVVLYFDGPIPENYEIQVQLYLTNLNNNGQEYDACQFNQLVTYNLNPLTMGCTDMNAENYNSEAIIDDGYCLYTSNCDNIYIDLYEGWNLVGFSCTNELDAVSAFSPYIENLIIVKDYLGNAYLPDWDFNGIGNLDRGFGYQIKITNTIQDFNLCNE